MTSNVPITFVSTATFLLAVIFILIIVPESNTKPWPQNSNPSEQITPLESGNTSCPEETQNLCQRCAKQTKSPVVYPWCCTNYEAARDWCVEYLEFGLPLKTT